MNYIFDHGFMWGGACSGPQSEGRYDGDGKAGSIWDYWYEKEPERFFDRIGPGRASDFCHQYKEIIAAMKAAGIRSYRTSIQWSRLIKDREGTVNEEGVRFYRAVFDELIAQGIEPMACLFHFDMPMYWMEMGGFENRDTVKAFADYAEVCFTLFGDKVKYWMTFNEPVVVVEGGYLFGFHYPVICDAKKGAQVAYHMQLASSMAVERFRKVKEEGQIGIVLNLTPSYCRDESDPADKKAADITDILFNRSFLDPSVKGVYPGELIDLLKEEGVIPETQQGDSEVIRANTVDFLGVNYYHPRRVKARETSYEGPLTPDKYYEEYTFEGMKMNTSRGWEIYEKALYDIAINVRDNYGNIPWFVSENGMGVQDEERFIDEDGFVCDDYRIAFIRDHLKWLHKGIEEGSRCFGYHLWCPFDSWSWTNAYKNRYGLIRVDVKNDCKIHLKRSAEWYRKLSEENGFSSEE